MSAISNWMPLYIGDYLGDTAHLTTEQHGAYLLLLMHQWRRGFLPADDESLAQITRCTIGRWKTKISGVVLPFFSAIAEGLIQRRLDKERAKTQKKCEEASRSAGSRWNKKNTPVPNDINDKPDANAYDPHMRTQCSLQLHKEIEKKEKEDSLSESLSESKKKESKKEPPSPKTPKPAPVALVAVLPNWMPLRSWSEFVEGRRQSRKPLTPIAAKILIRKLEGFHDRGLDVAAALDASTAAGWQGVFEPRQDTRQTKLHQPQKSAYQTDLAKKLGAMGLMDEEPADLMADFNTIEGSIFEEARR
jgi:uncharacterized protein YdaU (DUF1376 family)